MTTNDGSSQAVWTASSENAMTDGEMEEFLAAPYVARLATHRKDGLIHLTPVWFLYEDSKFWFALGESRRHLRNLRRDPRATILIDVDERPNVGGGGDVRAVMACGTVEIFSGAEQVDPVSSRIDLRYLGAPPVDADPLVFQEAYELVALTPTVLKTWDFSK